MYTIYGQNIIEKIIIFVRTIKLNPITDQKVAMSNMILWCKYGC